MPNAHYVFSVFQSPRGRNEFDQPSQRRVKEVSAPVRRNPLLPRWRATALGMAVCLLASAQAAFAQGVQDRLGTLFFSPAERNLISAVRRGEEVAQDGGVGAKLSLTGVVSRAGRKGTAWINGRPVFEGAGSEASGSTKFARGRVEIDGRSVRVRETADLDAEGTSDVLPPGSVIVRRAK